jgi:hypothetical protein
MKILKKLLTGIEWAAFEFKPDKTFSFNFFSSLTSTKDSQNLTNAESFSQLFILNHCSNDWFQATQVKTHSQELSADKFRSINFIIISSFIIYNFLFYHFLFEYQQQKKIHSSRASATAAAVRGPKAALRTEARRRHAPAHPAAGHHRVSGAAAAVERSIAVVAVER